MSPIPGLKICETVSVYNLIIITTMIKKIFVKKLIFIRILYAYNKNDYSLKPSLK